MLWLENSNFLTAFSTQINNRNSNTLSSKIINKKSQSPQLTLGFEKYLSPNLNESSSSSSDEGIKEYYKPNKGLLVADRKTVPSASSKLLPIGSRFRDLKQISEEDERIHKIK